MSLWLCNNGVDGREACTRIQGRKYSCSLDSFRPTGAMITRCSRTAITCSTDNNFSLTASHLSKWCFVKRPDKRNLSCSLFFFICLLKENVFTIKSVTISKSGWGSVMTTFWSFGTF